MSDVFVEHRPLLFSLAYRMLGTASDAEDIVQESFLRWSTVDASTVASPKAYLASIVTRLCLDHLGSARIRREQYVGPWLPEPVLVEDDVAVQAENADFLSTAFLVVLETLSPLERAAFLLHEVFAYPYADVAQMLGRSEPSCRQLIHRAREHVAARRPRFPASRARQRELTERFVAACATGELSALVSVLTEDAVLLSDGGDQARAAKRPISSADNVARFLLGVVAKAPQEADVTIEIVNGQWGIVSRIGGHPFAVVTLDCVEDGVQQVHVIVNPEKLAVLSAT